MATCFNVFTHILKKDEENYCNLYYQPKNLTSSLKFPRISEWNTSIFHQICSISAVLNALPKQQLKL